MSKHGKRFRRSPDWLVQHNFYAKWHEATHEKVKCLVFKERNLMLVSAELMEMIKTERGQAICGDPMQPSLCGLHIFVDQTLPHWKKRQSARRRRWEERKNSNNKAPEPFKPSDSLTFSAPPLLTEWEENMARVRSRMYRLETPIFLPRAGFLYPCAS